MTICKFLAFVILCYKLYSTILHTSNLVIYLFILAVTCKLSLIMFPTGALMLELISLAQRAGFTVHLHHINNHIYDVWSFKSSFFFLDNGVVLIPIVVITNSMVYARVCYFMILCKNYVILWFFAKIQRGWGFSFTNLHSSFHFWRKDTLLRSVL